MSDKYSQGIIHSGAVVLKNGVPLTIDQVVERLNKLEQLRIEAEGLVMEIEKHFEIE